MKTSHIALAAALALAGACQAQTMYRCGNTFSQQPCAPDARAVAVPTPAAGAVKAPTDKPVISEADRLNKLTDESQKDRRRRDLRDRIIPSATADLNGHRYQCAQRQAALEDDQYSYRQNLYGKIHASQRASEMAANAATCDTKDRELKDQLDTLQKECAALNCGKM